MGKIIMHPTPEASWQALIHEAQGACSLTLTDEMTSYLMFLMMRFTQKPDIASNIMALDFLEGASTPGSLRQDKLQEVGDKCLIISGLFPARAKRRRVKISYYVDIGQSAYGLLSIEHHDKIADLFSELCEQFVLLRDILHAMADLGQGSQGQLLPLDAQALWEDTGSAYAKALLTGSCSKNTPIMADPKNVYRGH